MADTLELPTVSLQQAEKGADWLQQLDSDRC